MYGNIMNRIMEGAKSPEPVVGMPATITAFSDRYAVEVVGVSESKRRIVVRYMQAGPRHVGMSESQDWELTSDPTRSTETFSLRKNGRWVQKGSKTGQGNGLILGVHDHYYDYGF